MKKIFSINRLAWLLVVVMMVATDLIALSMLEEGARSSEMHLHFLLAAGQMYLTVFLFFGLVPLLLISLFRWGGKSYLQRVAFALPWVLILCFFPLIFLGDNGTTHSSPIVNNKGH
jgi:hypothetical protein